MSKQAWLWAACLIGTCCIAGCSDDSDSKGGEEKPPVGGEESRYCGNGALDTGESCDDGNTQNGDGCSSTCTIEAGWVCPNNKCEQKEPEPVDVCGNGKVETGEACDDGNVEDGDGCSSTCAVETGYVCDARGCRTTCGDGIKAGAEECDDGNLYYEDGCSSDCRLESGWKCPTPGQPCVSNLVEVCGNGIVTASEYCDDGNTEDGDGCSSTCKIEEGWYCNDARTECHTECGDGYIAGDEACDDTNNYDDDGCSSECKLEADWVCDNSMGYSICATASCGDSIVHPNKGEQCDIGPQSMEDSQPSYGWSAADNGPYCKMCKLTGYCGDGIVQANEKCDLGVVVDGKPTLLDPETGLPVGGVGGYGEGTCNPDCTFTPRCGDGIVNTDQGEVCDTGTNNGAYGGCMPGCKELAPFCGDGELYEGEVCDEGVVVNGKKVGGTGAYGHCQANCLAWSDSGYCGDKKVNGNEGCDFGKDETTGASLNVGGYNGCLSDCSGLEFFCGDKILGNGLEGDAFNAFGEVCDLGIENEDNVYGGCSTTCQLNAYCGDGITNGDEECDPKGGDYVLGEYGLTACSADCVKMPYCGDGNIDAAHGEECDDGGANKDGLYGGCSSTCKLNNFCGDGKTSSEEACDPTDKANWNSDAYGIKGCTATCDRVAYCGDGIVQTGEVCDEGYTTDYKNGGLGNTVYGACLPDCSGIGLRCGDGVVTDGEECDAPANGFVIANYGSNACTSQCLRAAYCGDGIVNGSEVCDEGYLTGYKNGGDGTYGHCKADCTGIGGYCGDGKTDTANGEECDYKASGYKQGTYGKNTCTNYCTKAPYCGDGIVSNGEVCDEGYLTGYKDGGDGTYGHCKADCTGIALYCGDGVWTQASEACDPTSSSWTLGTYGEKACTNKCVRPAYCGDGHIDTANGETCDDGTANNVGGYGKCNSSCQYDTYCGDGKIQSGYEVCDNGSANTASTYATCNKTTCIWNAVCGDGIVDSGYEKCDDGALKSDGSPLYTRTVGGKTVPAGGDGKTYGTCKQDCSGYVAYCGDGVINGDEQCDNGSANTASTYGTCNKTTCMWNAICGDGIKQSGEFCDDGGFDSNNNPYYTRTVSGKTVPAGGPSSYSGASDYELCNANCTSYVAYCGDGVINGSEICDDKKDGAACHNCEVVKGYMCQGGDPACPDEYCKNKSKSCTLISDLYGDGALQEDFEDCDDGNKTDNDGCTQGKIDAGYICPTVGKRCVAAACGDGIRAYGEECDDKNTTDNDGCSSRCKLEEGYKCTVVKNGLTTCTTTKGYCGDKIVQTGEACDDGNTTSGDGCSASCTVENGYRCPVAGGACSTITTCGNGNLDTNSAYNSSEECDDSNTQSGDGCSKACRIETGYHCTTMTDDGKTFSVCTKGRCNDGYLDVGEECDDGNAMPNDGCSPSCKREYMFDQYIDDDGVVSYSPKCGDGITLWMIPKTDESGNYVCKTVDNKDAASPYTGTALAAHYNCKYGFVPAEMCDDGNLVSGDGCSSQCEIEDGYTCTDFSAMASSKTIDMDITYYDFRARPSYTTLSESAYPPSSLTATTEPSQGGWMTTSFLNQIKAIDATCATNQNKTKFSGTVQSGKRYGYPDFGCTYSGSGCKGMVESSLDADGKPVIKSSPSSCTLSHLTCRGTHYYWYRYVKGLNLKIDSKLTMTQDANDADKYSFMKDKWYPLQGMGYALSETANGTSYRYGNFTSELHTYFQYKGGETLSFRGDDDVWAFINRKLFVDLGGMQSGNSATETLSNAKCSFEDKDGKTKSIVCDNKFDIYENGIYELHFFQAERCDSGSLYQLTLDGFLKTGQSVCTAEATTCGNGQLDSGEDCDLVSGTIKYSSSVSSLNPSGCTGACKAQYCGDGIVNGSEECDLGAKNANTATANCTTSCKLPVCGDGIVQRGETCDKGSANVSSTTYSSTPKTLCTTSCNWAPYCGDGIINGSEKCDNGKSNKDPSVAYGEGVCTTSCNPAPYCGDGFTNGPAGRENCDNGSKNSDTAYGKDQCTSTCKTAPYCGDRKVTNAEECDRGNSNSASAYGPSGCTDKCKLAPYCGDGSKNNSSEECDNGLTGSNANQADAYGENSCTLLCKVGGYCGDGDVNGGEECDLGAGNNTGAYGGCTANCKLAAYCGDGTKNGSEECDLGSDKNDGSYGGCRQNCTLSPYCGDGSRNDASEECDLGTANNTGSYNGCTSTCKKGPSCGDGIQNDASEECDLGTEKNTGAYGSCKANCTKAPYCGDGYVNDASEECDLGAQNGVNQYNGCSASCKKIHYCGDGVKDADEQCDLGANKNTGAYGGCRPNCTLAPYCGDGLRNDASEECDNGANNGDGSYNSCSKSCTKVNYCGDGIVNGSEQCDKGTANNTGAYGGCKSNCMLAARCGDGLKNGSEQCDLGTDSKGNSLNVGGYNGCKADCTKDTFCGDGVINGAEDCDNGVDKNGISLNVGGYNGCTAKCKFGPYCGDGTRNGDEQCDKGTAANVGGYNGCKADCTKDMYCGDGVINGDEQCDNGVDSNGESLNVGGYGGCKADCSFAAYCGDGVINGDEQCDDPAGNTGAYGGCNNDCSLAPYCGDGIKNGDEQCDGKDTPAGFKCTDTCTATAIIL